MSSALARRHLRERNILQGLIRSCHHFTVFSKLQGLFYFVKYWKCQYVSFTQLSSLYCFLKHYHALFWSLVRSEVVEADLEASGSQHTIQDLPEELIIYIFSFLCPSDLCISAAKVCTSWTDLAYSPSLWRSKDYKCQGDQKIEERDEIFYHAPCLRGLTIASLGCVDTSALLSALKGRVLSVSELVLIGRRLGSEFFRDVSE